MAMIVDHSGIIDASRGEKREDCSSGLIIDLLGGFRVSVGGRTIDESEWYLRKAKSLIKLLALAENRRLHRGQITDLLWPELDLKAAANNLHKAVYIARRVLEPTLPPKASSRFLQLNGDFVTLNVGDGLIDVEAFRAAVERAQATQDLSVYQEAVRLYGGDLLPEDRYEEWTIRLREELRHLYLSLLLELAELHAHRSQSSEAVDVLRQVVGIDHANEQAHVALIHLLASSGQRQAALRQYGLLRDALQEELGAEPDAAAQDLYAEILSGRYVPGQITRGAPVELTGSEPSERLVGRFDDVQRMRQRLNDLFDGRGGVIFLHGEAGTGKSSLAAMLHDEAVQRGAVTLWGAAYRDEDEVPYNPLARTLEGFALRVAPQTLRKLADEYVAELAHLAPAFSRAARRVQDGDSKAALPSNERIVSALVHFFTILSDHVPLLITLEDLHLADISTISFLERMAHLLPEMQILFLCTLRSTEIPEWSDLHRLCRERGAGELVDCIEVKALPPNEMSQLASRILGAPISDEVLSIIGSVSRGIPYYVEEVAWALRGRRRIEQLRGVWQIRKGIRLAWDRDDVRQLADAAGDFELARKLRSL